MRMRELAVLPIALAIAVTLGGCVGEPSPTQTDTPIETTTPTPAPSETPAARTFVMPEDCLGMLSQERQDSFAAQNITLLGGPGGKFEHYYADPTPEEQAGGISCIWGDENVPTSTITVSVAPLTLDSRSLVVDNLLAQGLNEAVLDDGISYAQIGDENSVPAILNIVRNDSWISIIEALGGEAFFDEAVELESDVADQVYVP